MNKWSNCQPVGWSFQSVAIVDGPESPTGGLPVLSAKPLPDLQKTLLLGIARPGVYNTE
jgi:hypothetical protein